MIQRMVANLVGAQNRYETLNGKQYLVVPTVMMTEGVHDGSQGPLFYSKDLLSRDPDVWNHKPLTLYHPLNNGSACTKETLETQGLGMMLNSSSDGRLKTESWFDDELFKQRDPETRQRVLNKEMVEVSTGIKVETDNKPGVFNGEPYKATVLSMLPDHLAVLPDQKGACSVEDGAGLVRNTASQEVSFDDIREQIRTLIKAGNSGCGYCYVADVYPKYAVYETDDGKTFKVGYSLKNGKVVLSKDPPEAVRKLTSYVTANGRIMIRNEDQQGPVTGIPAPTAAQLSPVMKKQQMQKALEEKYKGIQQTGDWGGWVVDIIGGSAVYSKDGKLFRLPYTYDDDKINFTGEAEEVELVQDYRTRRNEPIDGNSSPYNLNKESGTMANQPTNNTIHAGAGDMIRAATSGTGSGDAGPGKSDGQARIIPDARKAAVSSLISTGFATEGDRTNLEGMGDSEFESIRKWAQRGANQTIQPYSYAGIGDRSAVNQQQTAADYIKSAPPEIAEVLQNALATVEAEKAGLVKLILSNSSNVFNEAWLKAQKVELLRGMARLSGRQAQAQPVHNYAGQADIPMFNQQPMQANNAAADESQMALPLPTIFNESGDAKRTA